MSETASIHAIPNDSSSSERETSIAVSLWFDMQPNADAGTVVPHWARTLAQAHVDHEMLVLAHPDTAYARSGLVGDIIQGSVWPDDAWQATLAQGIARARAHGTQQLVVLLPYRSSPVLWTQWALMTFAQMGARLDNTTGLLQGMDDWERTLHRADALRWLIIDRVITYGVARAPADYLPQMRAFNPMARWVHDSLVNKDVLLQGLNAYHKAASLAQIALKKDDLGAWNANKVVYFSSYSAVDRAKITSLIRRWRQQYSHQIVRLWAAIRVKDVAAPLAVSGIHHLWSMEFVPQYAAEEMTESGVWLLGQGIDVATLRAELEQCSA